MDAIKPPRLKKGDTIGAITLSNPLSQKHIEIINHGINRLKDMGFNVKIGRTIKVHEGMLTAGSVEERIADFNEMLEDKSVKAIFFAWGGDNASQILPKIDFKNVIKNPKIFMGHSDPMVILNSLTEKAGLITFYGHFISSFDPQWEWFSDYDMQLFNDVLIKGDSPIILPPAVPRECYRSGSVTGEIVGGCITDLIKLIGTPYCPSFKNKILILESYIIKPGELLSAIVHLKQAGVFDGVGGLWLGNFIVDESKQKCDLKKMFLDELKEYNFPIIKTKDFGHNSHMGPIPIGCKFRLDSNSKEITLLEPAVA